MAVMTKPNASRAMVTDLSGKNQIERSFDAKSLQRILKNADRIKKQIVRK